MERKLRVLQFDLLIEDVNDELKCLSWAKLCNVLCEHSLLDHFHIKYVIDKADKKIYLTYDD